MSTTGKAILALRALEKTDEAQPLTEHGVWRVVRRDHPEHESMLFHDALKKLVYRELAVRTGRRGGYEWYITESGKEVLRGLT